MIEEIERLIAETRAWKDEHRSKHRLIEAMACEIRLQALKQCLEIAKRHQ